MSYLVSLLSANASPSQILQLSASGQFDWERRGERFLRFDKDSIGINAGVQFDPESSPDELLSVSEAGGAVSLGGSIFAMPQGFRGNASLSLAPFSGADLILKPGLPSRGPEGSGQAGVFSITSETEVLEEVRVGKDLQSDEPCARGLSAHIDPATETTEFGSMYNDVAVMVNGDVLHTGNIEIEGGGLRMGTGVLRVANLDLRRARKSSFLGDTRFGVTPDANLTIKGRMQFIDTRGEVYAFIDPSASGYVQARNVTVGRATWLRSNVVLGGGDLEPVAGWVSHCDAQRRGGGNDLCATSLEYRAEKDAGLLTIKAGMASMISLSASGMICVGELCNYDWTAEIGVNGTREAVTKSSLAITGTLQFLSSREEILGTISPAEEIVSTSGAYRVDKAAHLLGDVRLVGDSSRLGGAALQVNGLVEVAAPVNITTGLLTVHGVTQMGTVAADRMEITRLLQVISYDPAAERAIAAALAAGNPAPNNTYAHPPQFVSDAVTGYIWGNGEMQVDSSVTLMQDVVIGQQDSLLETKGVVQTRQAVTVAENFEITPLEHYRLIYYNNSLEHVTDNATLDTDAWWYENENVTAVPVFTRRQLNVSANMFSTGLGMKKRLDRLYVDMSLEAFDDADDGVNESLSTLRIGGNADLGTLEVSGLIRLAKNRTDNDTLFSANPRSGDVMVRESLTTRGRSVVHGGAEFGPVQVYSYWLYFENETVYNWTLQGDSRCDLAHWTPGVGAESYECDMVRWWKDYRCFSEWRQPTYSREQTCSFQFNGTLSHIALRVPLEEIYVEYSTTVEGLVTVLEPPIFLRTLAPADTTIRASLMVNRSVKLSNTVINEGLSVEQSVAVSGSATIAGAALIRGRTTIVGEMHGANGGSYSFSAMPGVGGYVSTEGQFNVNGSATLKTTVTFGESPVDTLVLAASALFNNTIQAQSIIAAANLTAENAVTLHKDLVVRGNVSAFDDVTLIGNLVFDSSVYRTFSVDTHRQKIRSSGTVTAGESLHVNGVVACPALQADLLYINDLIGTSPSGALIEDVPIRDGGFEQPKVDVIEAITADGVTVDSAVVNDGALHVHNAGWEPLGGADNATLVTIVNSGHAPYMVGTSSSIAFFHTGYPGPGMELLEAGDQSAAITVGTETDWTQQNRTQNAFLSVSTASQGAVGERMRIKANGDVVLNTDLGYITAEHGHFTVKGDFHLLQVPEIVVVEEEEEEEGGNSTNSTNVTVALSFNNSNVTIPEPEPEDVTIDPVPKMMEIVSLQGEVSLLLAAARDSQSVLQLHSAPGPFDFAYSMIRTNLAEEDGSCTPDLVDSGSALRISGTVRELMSVISLEHQAHVYNSGSATFCNATSAHCDITLLSHDSADIGVSAKTGNATLTLQSGWNRISSISLGDQGTNGRNNTFAIVSGPSYVCRDNYDWVIAGGMYGGRNCMWFRYNDPGCEYEGDIGQLDECPLTCNLCPDGAPIPHFDIVKDGKNLFHVVDQGSIAFTQVRGDVSFGFCEQRNPFGICTIEERDVTVSIFSPDGNATVDVISQSTDAVLKLVSGYSGAAGVTFAQQNASTLIQMAKRGLSASGFSLDFTDSDDNILLSLATPRSPQAGDLRATGSATFGSDSSNPHTVMIESQHEARCNVRSTQENALFVLAAGYAHNSSLVFKTAKVEYRPRVNDTDLALPAFDSEFTFVNEGTVLQLRHASFNATDNTSSVRNVLSLVVSSNRGDFSFNGDGRFCDKNATDALCLLQVQSGDGAMLAVISDNSTAQITLLPGPDRTAMIELVTRNTSSGLDGRTMKIYTNPNASALEISTGNSSTPMISLLRTPSITPSNETTLWVRVHNETANTSEMIETAVYEYLYYGYVEIPGNGVFGSNSTEGAALTVASMNSSSVLVGSNSSQPNASAAVIIASDTGAAVNLVRNSSDGDAVFRIVTRDSRSTSNATLNQSNPSNETNSKSTEMLFIESMGKEMISLQPVVVERQIQQHTLYRLKSMEFFCKVAFVRVVDNCDGIVEDPQAAWSQLFLRECKVPCYTNLMPWMTVCASRLDTFEELSPENLHLIELQHIVCTDYYGPYTGPPSDVALEALYLFHDLEQEQGLHHPVCTASLELRIACSCTLMELSFACQSLTVALCAAGPYTVNVTVDDTWVIQTRVQEIQVNETVGDMHTNPSIVLGELGVHNLSRQLSVTSKGAASVTVESRDDNAQLVVRAGLNHSASIAFVRSNDLPNRQDLVVERIEAGQENESIATQSALHYSLVHSFRWATFGNGTLSVLGYSTRRPQGSKTLLLPFVDPEPVQLMVLDDQGSVGTLGLGGSARFGIDGYGFQLNALGSAAYRAGFVALATASIGLTVADGALIPVDAVSCTDAGLDEFCLTGPSVVTPRLGGSVDFNVTWPATNITIPGGACRSTTDPTQWSFEGVYSNVTNVTHVDENGTFVRSELVTEIVMNCSGGYVFARFTAAADVWSVTAALEAMMEDTARATFNETLRPSISGADVDVALKGSSGYRNETVLTVQSSDGRAQVNLRSGNGSAAVLSISAGSHLPSVRSCASHQTRAEWIDMAFLDDVYETARNGSNRTDIPWPALPLYNQSFGLSRCGDHDYSTATPRSVLKFVSGTSVFSMAAHLGDDGTDTLRIQSEEQDLLSVSENLEQDGSFRMTVFGDAAFGAQCPPNCNVSSLVHVLGSQNSAINVISENSTVDFSVAAAEGRSAMFHLRQANASVFTLQSVGSSDGSMIKITQHTDNLTTTDELTVPYPSVEMPEDPYSLLELSGEVVTVSGTIDCNNLVVKGEVPDQTCMPSPNAPT